MLISSLQQKLQQITVKPVSQYKRNLNDNSASGKLLPSENKTKKQSKEKGSFLNSVLYF